MRQENQRRGYKKDAVLVSFVEGKVESEMQLIRPGSEAGTARSLHVELVPHGNLSPGVPQHFFPMAPLRARDM